MYKACYIDHIVKSIKKNKKQKNLWVQGFFSQVGKAALPLILGLKNLIWSVKSQGKVREFLFIYDAGNPG
jgi:hypothetical protein